MRSLCRSFIPIPILFRSSLLDGIAEHVGVAEGVSTAGAVIALAQKYNVKMPVLTAVARIIDHELTPKKAGPELMSIPQALLY
ncbi:hypothetical protein FF1_001645 [Malus domestica]